MPVPMSFPNSLVLIHNRYASDLPSGENRVVEREAELLKAHGHGVEKIIYESDDILSLIHI